MSNLMEQYVHYHNSLQEINRRAKEEPAAFAEESESVYRAELMRIAEKRRARRGIAALFFWRDLCQRENDDGLAAFGLSAPDRVSSYVFSLDNFI